MIEVTKDLRSARLADIRGGNLVAFKRGEKLQVALAVTAGSGSSPQKGALLLEEGPKFVTPGGYCLDFGKPIVQWNFDKSISQGLPPVGCLVVHTDGALIAGIGLLDRKSAWKLGTGEESPSLDLAAAFCVSDWVLGLKDTDGHFQVLFQASGKCLDRPGG